MPGIGLGIAKCPYDPLDNSTAIYVENGNPGGLPALVSTFYYNITYVQWKQLSLSVWGVKKQQEIYLNVA